MIHILSFKSQNKEVKTKTNFISIRIALNLIQEQPSILFGCSENASKRPFDPIKRISMDN